MELNELISQISDENVRTQVKEQFAALSGSALRKELEAAKAQVNEFKTRDRQNAFKAAGLPEAAFDVIDGIYDGELEPDQIRQFAASKGFAVSDGATAPDPATQRAEGEARLAQVNAGALPSRDPSVKDEIAEADAKGDFATADRLRAQMLLQA